MCYGPIRERAFLPVVVVVVVVVRECNYLDAIFPIQVYIGTKFCPFGNVWSSARRAAAASDVLRDADLF
jgi:hypothetical protein